MKCPYCKKELKMFRTPLPETNFVVDMYYCPNDDCECFNVGSVTMWQDFNKLLKEIKNGKK